LGRDRIADDADCTDFYILSDQATNRLITKEAKMPLLGLMLFLTILGGMLWWGWQMQQRLAAMQTRITWHEVLLRQAGIPVSNDDYIKYCLLTEGTPRALSEYVRIYEVNLLEARRAVEQMEKELGKRK